MKIISFKIFNRNILFCLHCIINSLPFKLTCPSSISFTAKANKDYRMSKILFIKTSQPNFISATPESKHFERQTKQNLKKRHSCTESSIRHISDLFVFNTYFTHTLFVLPSCIFCLHLLFKVRFALSHFKPIYLHDKFCLFLVLCKHGLPSQHQI